MKLIDEQNDVPILGDLVHHSLEPLFELAPVLRAGDYSCHVEGEHPVVLQRLGAIPGSYELSEALDNCRLPYSGLAD